MLHRYTLDWTLNCGLSDSKRNSGGIVMTITTAMVVEITAVLDNIQFISSWNMCSTLSEGKLTNTR